jgi:DNA-binding response OmpR family regulator
MSGLANEDDRRRAREAGFHAHLKKPFDATAVIAAVEAAIRYRKERPSAPIAKPAGTAKRKPARAERRSAPRGAGDGSAGAEHRKTVLAANRDEARRRSLPGPKR